MALTRAFRARRAPYIIAIFFTGKVVSLASVSQKREYSLAMSTIVICQQYLDHCVTRSKVKALDMFKASQSMVAALELQNLAYYAIR